MEYKYKAIDQNNNVVEGIESAEDKFRLANFLKADGLALIDATETTKKGGAFSLKSISLFGGIKTHEKIIFARNIASMLDAGLSLTRALGVMEKQNKKPSTKKVISEINKDIKKGVSFSGALQKHPKVFNDLFVSIVRAGEESGNLVDSLNQVANQIEKIYLLKKKIKGAMIYPSIIIFAMIIIAILMMIMVVPTLKSTFEGIGADLPPTTKLILGLSSFLENNIIISLIIIVILGAVLYFSLKTKIGKKIFDLIILKIPVISTMVIESNSAKTARTMSSLLKAGVPYLNTMKITKQTVSNHYYLEVLEKAEKNVEIGLPVSKIFEDNQKYYPAFFSEMTAVGEETGELSEMLQKVADFYENEVDQKTKNLSTIIEPVLMLLVGAAVGFFAISMLSPMYSLLENI